MRQALQGCRQRAGCCAVLILEGIFPFRGHIVEHLQVSNWMWRTGKSLWHRQATLKDLHPFHLQRALRVPQEPRVLVFLEIAFGHCLP